jgi:hypothetical protein
MLGSRWSSSERDEHAVLVPHVPTCLALRFLTIQLWQSHHPILVQSSFQQISQFFHFLSPEKIRPQSLVLSINMAPAKNEVGDAEKIETEYLCKQ